MSANCSCEEIGSSLRHPWFTFSRTMWQSISMCLVRSWKTGLQAIWMADLLSQYKVAGWMKGTWKSCRRYVSHWSSHVVDAKARYSASEELFETVGCFFEHQEMSDGPRYIENPVMERLVSRQLAQSESLKALSCRGLLAARKIPELGELLRYHKTRKAAYEWAEVGWAIYWLSCWTTWVISGWVLVR